MQNPQNINNGAPKKTVYVLGAGASLDSGFPSGPELVQLIYSYALDEQNKEQSLLKKIAKCCPDVNPIFEDVLLEKFAVALKGSNVASIDDFLAASPAYFKEIGKILIAFVLSKFETPENLVRAEAKEFSERSTNPILKTVA